MQRGMITFFHTTKGFGFIQSEEGVRVFFHTHQRHPDEKQQPQEGKTIYFHQRKGDKGPFAWQWRFSEESAPIIDPEQDRRDGYRPGVMIALRWGDHFLLGQRRGLWTWILSTVNDQPHDAPDWMFSSNVPGGGIEEGETCLGAIRRELEEELGDYRDGAPAQIYMPRLGIPTTGESWSDLIEGEPKFLFKERSDFRVEKDGKVYRGKALYAYLVNIRQPPDEACEWMMGPRGENWDPFPCPAFEGGALFHDFDETLQMIRATQKGAKGNQLVRLFEMAQAA